MIFVSSYWFIILFVQCLVRTPGSSENSHPASGPVQANPTMHGNIWSYLCMHVCGYTEVCLLIKECFIPPQMPHRWWKSIQHELHYFRKCKHKFSLIPLREPLPWKETPIWNHNDSNWCEMNGVEGASYIALVSSVLWSGQWETQARYWPLSALLYINTTLSASNTCMSLSISRNTALVWYHSWLNFILQPLPSPGEKQNKTKQLNPRTVNIAIPFPGEEIIKPCYGLLQWKIVLQKRHLSWNANPPAKQWIAVCVLQLQLGEETKTSRRGWDANLQCTLLTDNVLI